MCYMAARVGIRDLRQNLSVYIRRVIRGETFQVTDRGRAVAVLAPIGESSSAIEQLIATGRAVPSKGPLAEVLPPGGKTSTRLSDALRAERAERL